MKTISFLSVLAALGVAFADTPIQPSAPAHPPFDATWPDRCIVLSNDTTRAVVDPTYGGRLVEYSLNGTNALYQVPGHPDWIYPEGNHDIGPAGGRFDVGPESLVPRHLKLWEGKWKVEAADPCKVVILNEDPEASGLRITREFRLDASTSKLTCIQSMTNITGVELRRSYWGRCFVPGGGVLVIPLAGHSRYPRKYIQDTDWPDFHVVTRPQDPAVTNVDDCLVVHGEPTHSKLAVDSSAGWVGYLSKQNLLFVKRFPVYPTKRYPEIASTTLAFWFHNGQICEIEPIGPEETLAPGQSASFQEEWWLVPYECPQQFGGSTIGAVVDFVKDHAFSEHSPPNAQNSSRGTLPLGR